MTPREDTLLRASLETLYGAILDTFSKHELIEMERACAVAEIAFAVLHGRAEVSS